MSWSTRLHTSWELLQRSLQVLRRNPRLVIFPLVSTACGITLALFFATPIIAFFVNAASAGEDVEALGQRLNAFFYAYGVLAYIVGMTVGTFFNVAFYHEILRAFADEPVSLRNGLRFALRRLWPIVVWSLLACTVGLIIRAIEERLGWLGRIIMGFIGLVWSVAAVFAIPVIVRQETKNPFAILRDSAATLKRTWGESLLGYVGIQLGGVLFLVGSLLFFGLAAIAMIVTGEPFFLLAAACCWVIALVICAVVLGMASDVYRCALYVYASEGVVPAPYTTDMMNAAWKIKKA